jgi:hypothetical protein
MNDANHDPDEEREGPVPAGLKKVTDSQIALAEFYGVDRAFIAAAALESARLPDRSESANRAIEWLSKQPQVQKDAWLAELMNDPESAVRGEILEQYAKNSPVPAWPTTIANRTFAELVAAAEKVSEQMKLDEAAAAARKRAKKLAAMGANPDPILRKTEELVRQRSGSAYDQIADLLFDLREALAGTSKANLAHQQALKLRGENPTLSRLKKAFKDRGLSF